ncbi:MAG: hypothetical protein ACLFR7_09480 [Opitutales bacterium]
MNLSEEQKATVAAWVAAGDNLAEIQRKLESELGLKMTYMDVRFLIDDLSLELADKPRVDRNMDLSKGPPPPAGGGAPGGAADGQDVLGKVSLTVDKLARPGAMVSGSVTFSDGVKASWLLDQMGRLALDGAGPGYRPPESDLEEFQVQLSSALRDAGYA